MSGSSGGAYPDRFALVKPVNPDDPAVADVIAAWKKTPGTVGVRIILTKDSKRAPTDPGLDRICQAAAKNDFPVNRHSSARAMWTRGRC